MSTESENSDNTSAVPPALGSDAPLAEGVSRPIAAQAFAGDEPGDEQPGEQSADEQSAEDGDASEGEPIEARSGGSDNEPPDDEGPIVAEHDEDDDEDDDMDVEPLEFIQEDEPGDEDIETKWYILKVQVNREESIRDALQRRVKIEGLDRYFKEIIVPTEDIAEFTKTGKRRIVKKKLYPGYIMVDMAINDDTWFVVRETPGIGDFTGSAGRPAPMDPADVERILKLGVDEDEDEQQIKTAIPFNVGDRVRVKDGYFQNFEGDVEVVDQTNGRVTVMINIFGRSTPVELEHWQIEAV